MMWVVIAGFLLCVGGAVNAGVLKCTPDNSDQPCTKDSRVLKKSDLLFGKECLPGTQWTSQCNECNCTSEGLASCGDKKCEGSENELQLRCAPDTIWRNDCNTCWCTSIGHPMCTRIGCNTHIVTDFNPVGSDSEESDDSVAVDYELEFQLSDDYFEVRQVAKRSICEPNARFEVECNSCKCSPSGQSYACTQSECLERDMDKEVEVFKESEGADHVERHSVCKPAHTFHIGCNTCQCNLEGTDFICATKPCPLLNEVEIIREIKALRASENQTKAVVCAANRMFVKDCNTCWCNDDGTSYFCTRKVCVPELPDEVPTEDKPEDLHEIKRKCRPDEVFELDCNMCRCNPDGKSFSCTRRACVPEEDIKNTSLSRKARDTSKANSRAESSPSRLPQHTKEAPKTCQPGSEFRLDCNKCLCDNEGQTFSCTRIDCVALNNNNNGGTRRKREVTTQVTQECKPGSVFQQGCKVCKCAEDGRHAVCPTRCPNEKEHSENEISNPDSDPSFRCNPGDLFKRGCNDCTCSADGRGFFCTLRFCEEDITPTI